VAAGAGLCPAGGEVRVAWSAKKEGAHGGTMGSPVPKEWDEYRVQLTQWELDRYLSVL
jgi:hypothetical protein